MDDVSHLRLNILTGEHVLVASNRSKRPWGGEIEEVKEEKLPNFDPKCYLCPGNIRANGEKNPDYQETFVFVNDFSSLIPQEINNLFPNLNPNLFQAETEYGVCEVVCYCKDHSKNLSTMEISEIEKVILIWQERFKVLSSDPKIKHIQIFENRGKEVGNSNLHPHGQIFAQATIPDIPLREIKSQQDYFDKFNSIMLLDYLKEELNLNQRVIFQNQDFVVLIPFWAAWPYEAMILPKVNVKNILDLNQQQVLSLTECLSKITKIYAQFFKHPLNGAPYSMGIHQAPTNNGEYNFFQTHIHFYPPLLTPNRKKFMVGYEMLAEQGRDLTPEQAAKQLKEATVS